MKTNLVAVVGGKGGVGKTTVAVGLAISLSKSKKVLLVDSDVDNPNCHESLNLKVQKLKDVTSFLPKIDESRCIKCGACVSSCSEHALFMVPKTVPKLLENNCSGCKSCFYSCPVAAIEESSKVLGEVFFAEKNNIKLVGGKLKPGEARSPLVVEALMEYAIGEAKNYDMVVVDCAPGVGSTVTRALKKANLAIVVTEPTPLGINTLKLSTMLLEKLSIPYLIVLNRANVSQEFRERILEEHNVVAEIPYDNSLIEASAKRSHIIIEAPNHPASLALVKLGNKISNLINLD
ncbi:MAG: AAA family ATPase [Thaumarchaeota archaeon]|nr:AAA family ATPase [Nitrososphaerota archaeon]